MLLVAFESAVVAVGFVVVVFAVEASVDIVAVVAPGTVAVDVAVVVAAFAVVVLVAVGLKLPYWDWDYQLRHHRRI